MNAHGYALFARVLACQTRVQGMVAANVKSRVEKLPVKYDDNAFYAEAQEIDNLSHRIETEGWQADS